MAEFSIEEKKELLALARQTVRNFLEEKRKEYPENTRPHFTEKRGVFVTLHRRGELRGCIGYPLPIKPLHQAVVDNAIAAAFEDPRFPPVRMPELDEIDFEISVLTVPRQIDHPDQVQIGQDGIIVSKGFRRGLLLPQVPVEQGWDLSHYLAYGCLKAGLAEDEWRRGVTIETFQAIVFGEKELEKMG